MLTIYKYSLEITDRQVLEMPTNSEILTVQLQREVPCLWAVVDTDEKVKEKRIIRIIGTGNIVPKCYLDYIGTFQMVGGDLIWHVFESAEEIT